jgi:hypothetical protein
MLPRASARVSQPGKVRRRPLLEFGLEDAIPGTLGKFRPLLRRNAEHPAPGVHSPPERRVPTPFHERADGIDKQALTGTTRLEAADQVLPSHLATPAALMPPAWVKLPPTRRSPVAVTARAETLAGDIEFVMPEPSGDQVEPFQRAMLRQTTPPAVENKPPAIKSPFGMDTSARTVPLMPLPNADQVPVTGSTAAMRLHTTVPA